MAKAIHSLVSAETVEADSYGMTKRRLRDAIVAYGNDGQYRLPSEAELSTQLGVSRVTVRSALQSLQKEGRIRRLHGHGTFINRHALGITANLAEATPFYNLIGDVGYEAGARVLAQQVVSLDEELAAALEVSKGTEALRVERVFTANGAPAVHSVDHLPLELIGGQQPEGIDPRRSTFELVSVTGHTVCYSVAEVRPVVAPRPVATALNIKRAQPLLRLRHTHIMSNEVPVAATEAHVNDEYVRFSVIRAYLDQ